MGLFGDKSKKSWQRLSFKNKQTKAGLLAREQSRSQRAWRLILTVVFAAVATLLIGSCQSFSAEATELDYIRGWAQVGAVVLVVHFLMLLLVRSFHRDVFSTLGTYLTILGLFLVTARLMQIPAQTGSAAYEDMAFLTPLPFFAMILAIVFGGALAVHSAMGAAALLGLMIAVQGKGVDAAFVSLSAALVLSQFLGSIVAILGVSRIRTRTRLVIVGLASGLAQGTATAVFSFALSSTTGGWQRWIEWLELPGVGFLNGLISGILITSLLPFLERWLDLTTEMRLLELADQNRPLLREMSLLAPGSFQHSLMVGQLAEEAAQSIGANDLLARVGALYHDVGKMLKPNYFVENIRGDENIHDRLSPEMSRLIIISHVKDGIRIAEEEGLPQPIVDMIPMHHGTSVVEYFYQKKRKQEEDQGLGETRDEAFQYPGPRPTFKEAGILMLADSTEAISRVIQDPTPARLRTLVRDVIRKKMADGQLDECELTMHDLHRIEDAFVRVLASIHHGRIKYPDQQKEEEKQRAEPEDEEPEPAGARGARAETTS